MHAYERGRLDLPFVGHGTFGKRPPCLDWRTLDAAIDLVAVAPAHDPAGITSILAVQVLLDFLGDTFHARADLRS